MWIIRVFFLMTFWLCVLVSGRCMAEEPVRLGVLNFTSKAVEVSSKQAAQVTDILTRMLLSSKYITLIERDRLSVIAKEKKLNLSGLVDVNTAIQVGKLAGCQYILLGAVTRFKEKVSVTDDSSFFVLPIPLFSIGYSKSANSSNHEITVTLDARVIDVKTGEVILSLAKDGTAYTSSESSSSGGNLTMKADFSDKLYGGALREQAIAQAASSLGESIREALVGEYACVVSIKGNTITINRGLVSGVQVGNLYSVNKSEVGNLNVRGKNFKLKTNNLAIIQVVDARDGFSIAELVEGSGVLSSIQRGNRVETITLVEAEDIIKRKSATEKKGKSPSKKMKSK